MILWKLHACEKSDAQVIGQIALHQSDCRITWTLISQRLSMAQCDPPFFSAGEWGLNPYPIFKRGLDRISIFRGGMLAKRGVTFFRGGCSFHIKNTLKSEIFHKKIYFLFGYGLACPKFSEITNRQYLWKGLSDFINFLHVIICILCDVH